MTDQIEQGTRLRKVLAFLKLSQTAVAQQVGMHTSYISQMCAGKSKLSGEFLTFFSDAHKDVNINWLLTGNGEMIVKPYETIVSEILKVDEPIIKYQPRPATAAVFGDLMELFESLERRIEALEQKNQTNGTK